MGTGLTPAHCARRVPRSRTRVSPHRSGVRGPARCLEATATACPCWNARRRPRAPSASMPWATASASTARRSAAGIAYGGSANTMSYGSTRRARDEPLRPARRRPRPRAGRARHVAPDHGDRLGGVLDHDRCCGAAGQRLEPDGARAGIEVEHAAGPPSRRSATRGWRTTPPGPGRRWAGVVAARDGQPPTARPAGDDPGHRGQARSRYSERSGSRASARACGEGWVVAQRRGRRR